MYSTNNVSSDLSSNFSNLSILNESEELRNFINSNLIKHEDETVERLTRFYEAIKEVKVLASGNSGSNILRDIANDLIVIEKETNNLNEFGEELRSKIPWYPTTLQLGRLSDRKPKQGSKDVHAKRSEILIIIHGYYKKYGQLHLIKDDFDENLFYGDLETVQDFDKQLKGSLDEIVVRCIKYSLALTKRCKGIPYETLIAPPWFTGEFKSLRRTHDVLYIRKLIIDCYKFYEQLDKLIYSNEYKATINKDLSPIEFSSLLDNAWNLRKLASDIIHKYLGPHFNRSQDNKPTFLDDDFAWTRTGGKFPAVFNKEELQILVVNGYEYYGIDIKDQLNELKLRKEFYEQFGGHSPRNQNCPAKRCDFCKKDKKCPVYFARHENKITGKLICLGCIVLVKSSRIELDLSEVDQYRLDKAKQMNVDQVKNKLSKRIQAYHEENEFEYNNLDEKEPFTLYAISLRKKGKDNDNLSYSGYTQKIMRPDLYPIIAYLMKKHHLKTNEKFYLKHYLELSKALDDGNKILVKRHASKGHLFYAHYLETILNLFYSPTSTNSDVNSAEYNRFKLSDGEDLCLALYLEEKMNQAPPNVYSNDYLNSIDLSFVEDGYLKDNRINILYLRMYFKYKQDIMNIIGNSPSINSIRDVYKLQLALKF